MTDTQRVKVSKEEFAEALFYWLVKQVNTKAIKQSAKLLDLKGKGHELFGRNLKSKEDSSKLVEELLALNMWLIARSCQRVFEDIDERNECLDNFHRIVYQRLIEGTEEDFGQWALSMTARYIGYDKAMKTDHTLGPLWELASVVTEGLLGKATLDAIVRFQIGVYASTTMEALEELIKQYDIE